MRRLINALFIACPLLIVACGGEPAASDGDGESSALERRSSPTSSTAFRRAVRELDSDWNDENIMNGSAHVTATTLRRPRQSREAQLEAFTKGVFAQEAAGDELEVQGTPKQKLEPLTSALRREIARITAVEGFVYADTRENIDPVKERLDRVIDLLGPSDKLDVARLDAKGTLPLDDRDGTWKAHVFTIFNRDSGAAITIYVREGWG